MASPLFNSQYTSHSEEKKGAGKRSETPGFSVSLPEANGAGNGVVSEGFFPPEIPLSFLDEAFHEVKRLVQLVFMPAAGLGEVRPATAATPGDPGHLADDITGVIAPADEVSGDRRQENRFILVNRAEDD